MVDTLTVLLWCIGLAGATVLTACTIYTIDTIRIIRKAGQVQNRINRDGR